MTGGGVEARAVTAAIVAGSVIRVLLPCCEGSVKGRTGFVKRVILL